MEQGKITITRRVGRLGAGAVALALAAALLCAAPARAFDLEGHRGARGLAPENTIAGFRRALQIGVTTLETDLAVTRDGVLVLSHDPHLNPDLVRGADGSWVSDNATAIHSLTLSELRGYDVGRLNPARSYARQWPEQQPADGERFPLLSELFDLVRTAHPAVRLNIETKITPTSGADTPDPETFATMVVGAVRAAGMAGRVTIQSFDWRTLAVVRRIAPEIPTSCLTIESGGMNTVAPDQSGASPWHAGLRRADHGNSLPQLVKAAGCGTWSMYWRNLSPDEVREARSLGIRLLPWTVDKQADMERLIGQGVDGLITDYPDRLRRVLAARGLALP